MNSNQIYRQRYESLLRWTRTHINQMQTTSLTPKELLGCMSAMQMLDNKSQQNWESLLGISFNDLYHKLENALEETGEGHTQI